MENYNLDEYLETIDARAIIVGMVGFNATSKNEESDKLREIRAKEIINNNKNEIDAIGLDASYKNRKIETHINDIRKFVNFLSTFITKERTDENRLLFKSFIKQFVDDFTTAIKDNREDKNADGERMLEMTNGIDEIRNITTEVMQNSNDTSRFKDTYRKTSEKMNLLHTYYKDGKLNSYQVLEDSGFIDWVGNYNSEDSSYQTKTNFLSLKYFTKHPKEFYKNIDDTLATLRTLYDVEKKVDRNEDGHGEKRGGKVYSKLLKITNYYVDSQFQFIEKIKDPELRKEAKETFTALQKQLSEYQNID